MIRCPACFDGLARPEPRGGRRPGFTLIEMIVAVAITTVLLFLVSRVFNDTTRAIADSNDISQILATTRVISDQLFDDGSRMITAKANQETQPGKADLPGAFLVIMQQRNAGVHFPSPASARPGAPDVWRLDLDGDGVAEGLDADSDGVPNETNGDDLVRTDQLIFFREGTRVESLTPANENRYDSDARGSLVRVVYGHVAPPVFDPNTGDLASGPDVGVFPHDNINTMTLGRQALLIADDNGRDPVSGNQLGSNPISTTSRALNYRPFPPGPLTYDLSDNIDTDALVNNAPSTAEDKLWTGVTDVVALGHAGFNPKTVTAGANRGWFARDMFEIVYPGTAAPLTGEHSDGVFQTSPYTVSTTFLSDALDADLLPTPTYQRAALSWGFFRADRRLVATSDTSYPFPTSEIARTHGFFAPHVSDFVVEFAADIRDDLGPDLNSTSSPLPLVLIDAQSLVTTNPIPIEPDNLPDGTPDTVTPRDANLPGNVAPVGAIKWYTADHLVNNPIFAGSPASYETGTRYPAYNPSRPLTWPIPRGASVLPGSGGTVLHSSRTAYPPYVGWFTGGDPSVTGVGIFHPDVSDPAFPTISNRVISRAAFVFGHTADADFNFGSTTPPPSLPPYPPLGDGVDGDGFEVGSNKWWPYMLRVRYRQHDGDGSYGSTDPSTNESLAGRWFEQIIAVPLK
ncbi:MAG: prepilin-type N-terminal cleavage/methylation domain-containing protein [Planctomycetota bacterium]